MRRDGVTGEQTDLIAVPCVDLITTGSQSTLTDLNDRVSSCQGFDRAPAALRLVVGPMVRLGLDVDLQAVRPRAGRQLPVERGQGRAAGARKHVHHVSS